VSTATSAAEAKEAQAKEDKAHKELAKEEQAKEAQEPLTPRLWWLWFRPRVSTATSAFYPEKSF
jgi:hypothetical protein